MHLHRVLHHVARAKHCCTGTVRSAALAHSRRIAIDAIFGASKDLNVFTQLFFFRKRALTLPVSRLPRRDLRFFPRSFSPRLLFCFGLVFNFIPPSNSIMLTTKLVVATAWLFATTTLGAPGAALRKRQDQGPDYATGYNNGYSELLLSQTSSLPSG